MIGWLHRCPDVMKHTGGITEILAAGGELFLIDRRLMKMHIGTYNQTTSALPYPKHWMGRCYADVPPWALSSEPNDRNHNPYQSRKCAREAPSTEMMRSIRRR